MLFTDYTYNSEHLGGGVWRLFVIKKDNIKFGATIGLRAKPPDELIFEIFSKNFNQFWIDAETISVNYLDKLEVVS